ncbi:MAG: DUF4832 domain-containing protein [Saprospiraceae bacterium]
MSLKTISITAFWLFFFQLLIAQTVTYTSSNEDFMNPDRGFYHPVAAAYASNFELMDVTDLINKRTSEFTPAADDDNVELRGNYQVRTSLIFRYYVLDSYVNTDNIPTSYLQNLEADFAIARQAGVRMIIRFAYVIGFDASRCGDNPCPPYGDAPLARVLAHIEAITPVLQANSDVISVVQQGFIGTWGEQYYTDFFGDASDLGDQKITNANWLKRNAVTEKILDAVPTNRMVQLRYPQLKQRYLGGVNAPVTDLPMTLADAFKGDDRSRLAFHNDCFLASPGDYGTYFDYGNDNSTPIERIDVLKPYAATDGQFTAIGGETCGDVDFGNQNNCNNDVVGIMDDLNYSFLNSSYNNTVNNDWQDGGCMDEIKRRLGYRFELENGTYPASANAGTTINITLNIENTGFTVPFNERKLFLVLRNTSTGAIAEVAIDGTNTDSRFWQPGSVQVSGNVLIPSDLPMGNYDLLLHLLDPTDDYRIAQRPEYSVRFANENTWESTTGFNDLQYSILINSTAQDCSSITIDGNFGDWSSVAAISTNGTNGLNALKVAEDADYLYLYAGANLDDNIQFYLDTDNNTTGGSEFTGSSWSATGFNFLIENTTLFSYNGTGSDFTWTNSGTVEVQRTGSEVEYRIAKNQLANLATTIQVGFAILDGNFSTTGRIPNASSAAVYTQNIQECDCTNTDLLLNGLTDISKNHETNAAITSQQIIFNSANIEYRAAQSIQLNQGFQVTAGSTFLATIDGCQSNSTVLPAIEQNNVIAELQVAPNPFRDQIQVNYQLENAGVYSLRIYDARGHLVQQIFKKQLLDKGAHFHEIQLLNDVGGVFFVQLQGEKEQRMKKVLGIKN